MFVNNYKINITTVSSASTATTINIPVKLEYQIVDQAELVERVFVETEVANSINPIFDYEKIRLTPTLNSVSNLTGGGSSAAATSGGGTVATSSSGSGPVSVSNGGGTVAASGPSAVAVSGITPANAATLGGFPVSTTSAAPASTNTPTVVGNPPSLANVSVPSAANSSAAGNLTLSNPVSAPLTTVSSSSSLIAAPSSNIVSTPASSSVTALGNVTPSNAATLGGISVTAAGAGNTAVNSGTATAGNIGNVGNLFSAVSGNNSLPAIFDSSTCSTNLSGTNVNNVVYRVSFLVGSPAAMNTNSTYGDIGYSDNDIKFRSNAFKNSFLNLLFYDSDNALEQRLISYITLYPNLTGNDLNPYDVSVGFPGQPKPASEIPVSFVISNPLLQCNSIVSEGFFLYDYKDTIPMGGTKYLYMRASYNNAKTGKSTNLMVDDIPYSIDNLVHKLYTRYVLVRNNTGFYYKIDDTYNLNTSGNNVGLNNVTYSNNNIIVNLYQIQAL